MKKTVSSCLSKPLKRFSASPLLAEMNVTPLVDVVLVLLIVFMVCAPLMQQGVSIDLPKTKSPALSESPEQLILSMSQTQQISLGSQIIPKGSFFKKIEAIALVKPKIQILIKADQSIPYGTVAQMISEVNQAGIKHVGLLTQPGSIPPHL